MHPLLPWAILNILTKVRYDVLLERYGALEKAWEHLSPEMLRSIGCREETIQKVMNEVEEINIDQHMTFLQKQNIRLLCISEPEFPEALANLPDPPVFLFAKGDLKLLKQPLLAIVGTRKMSSYGKRVLQTMMPILTGAGFVTVSGLAIGIDAAVAKETMAAGGKTIAVLGHGLGAIYPKTNARLADEIVENGGLLLTEYPLHINPDRYTFPARNRIIAGLSLGTIVVEAASQSGSLITASLALEYGKEVFAVPGPIFEPNMEGTHHLIQKSGATLITCAEDVLRELGVVPPSVDKEPSSYRPQTPEETTLQSALTSMPQTVDDLSEKTNLPIATLNATLTLMELKGGTRNMGMGQWVRL